jgi:hypothetical protein
MYFSLLSSARECLYKGSSIFSASGSSNTPNSTAEPQRNVPEHAAHLRMPAIPSIARDDETSEKRDSTQSDVQPPNVGRKWVPDSVAHNGKPTIIPTPVAPPSETQQQNALTKRAHWNKSAIASQEFNQLDVQKSIGPEKNGALSSLRFKKKTTVEPNTLPTSDIPAPPFSASQSDPFFTNHLGRTFPSEPSYRGHNFSAELNINTVQSHFHGPSQSLWTGKVYTPSQSHVNWRQEFQVKPVKLASIQTSETPSCVCARFNYKMNCEKCRSEIPKPKLDEERAEATSPEILKSSILPSEVAPRQGPLQHEAIKIYPNLLGTSTINTIGPTSSSLRDPSTDMTKSSTSSSRKRKGKEKEELRELGSSGDSGQPSTSKQRLHKKPKPPQDSQYSYAEDAQAIPQEVPTASSSRVRVEDLPPAPETIQRLTMEGFSMVNEDAIEQSVSSNHKGIKPAKPAKRRKRAHKAEEEAPSHPVDGPSNIKTDVEDPPIDCINKSLVLPIHSAITLTTKPKPLPKPKIHTGLTTVLQKAETGVPLPIPDELQVLVNAYINCTPVGIFATSKHIRGFWGLDLVRQEEIGYAFMGFYKVLRVWEAPSIAEAGGVVVREGVGSVSNEEIFRDRVQWRLRMGWEPGGEDWQVSARHSLSSPWWNPMLKVQGLSASSQPDREDSDDESTIRYRFARRESLNFVRRHCFFNQAYFSVLPLHLLAPVNVEIPDSAIPRGWHCQSCGKLNFRYYLRHKRCSSSYCQVGHFLTGSQSEVADLSNCSTRMNPKHVDM